MADNAPDVTFKPALAQGALVAIVTLLLAFCFDYSRSSEALNVLITYPFKWIFVAGVAVSIWLQVSVERFISENKLASGLSINVGRLSGLSSVTLAGLALLSLVSLDKFYWHASFVVAYLVWLVLLDGLFYFSARRLYNSVDSEDQKKIYRTKVCALVCEHVFLKIDAISLVSISGLYAVAAWLPFGAQIGVQISEARGLDEKTHGQAEQSLHDAEWNSFIEAQASVLQEILDYLPAFFFGGAVGAQLLFSAWILFMMMRDWRAKLQSEIDKAPDKEGNETIEAAT